MISSIASLKLFLLQRSEIADTKNIKALNVDDELHFLLEKSNERLDEMTKQELTLIEKSLRKIFYEEEDFYENIKS